MQEKLNSEHTLAAHQHLKLTQKFCVADLTEIPEGGQLARIILRLENEGKLNPLDEPYLNRYDLLAIADFSFGKINNDEFTIAISNRTSNKKQALAERFIEEHKVLQCEIDVLQRKKLARQQAKNYKADELRRAEERKANEIKRAIEKRAIELRVATDRLKEQQRVQRLAEEKQTYSKLISKYGFSDLDENKIFGTRLHSILRKLESENLSFNADDANYLIINEFFALQKFASREINFEDFTTQSLLEQDKRTIDTITERERIRIERENVYIELKLQQEQRAVLMRIEHDRILAEKIRHDNDPINIAKAKQEKLKNKYGISGFIEKDYFKKLIDILNKVDADTRLTDEDIVWLETTAKQYFTFELRKAYHRIEAKFHHDEFSTTKDPWSAVNASAHYRKSDQSRAANTLLSTIDIDTKKDTKLKSAFCTTHGGVKRDLRLQTEALTLGDKAHQLTPHNFRPCTLLGAVNMEIGNYDLGQSWYAKAVERGYTEKSVDEELKQIFKRADKIQKEALRTHLLKTDPVRYSWANTKNKA